LQLAKQGLYTTHPNPRVGCVLVKDERVISQGWHHQAGQDHAEIVALKAADDPQGATAYITLEPCYHHGRTGPCSQALIEAGVKRVVAAMYDPNPLVAGRGLQQLKRAGIEVAVGLMEAEAEQLNRGFCKRMRGRGPWVTSKIAMSLDGRTAMASGESQWITGAPARQDVHRLRASSSAIVTGIGTVLQDDPELTPRDGVDLPLVRPPDRVVIDSQLKTPTSARLIKPLGTTHILTCSNDTSRIQTLQAAGCEVSVMPAVNGRVDLRAVLEHLAGLEMNELLVEAGSVLNGALLEAGLVDEWVVYVAPCLMGDTAKGAFHLSDLTAMAQRYRLNITDQRLVGQDYRLRFRVQPDNHKEH